MTARARPCAERTRLFGLIAKPNGALRAPPPIAASLLLIRSPKIDKNYQSRAARVIGFFLSTGPQRLWNMTYSAPAPPIAASLILLAIWGKRVLFLCWQNTYRPFWGVFQGGQAFFFTHLGSKLCIGATIRPKFASFILFVVLSVPIVILFFRIFILINFSYSSLLISSYSSRTILPLLIFIFLYLNCCIDIKLTLGSFGQRYINKRESISRENPAKCPSFAKIRKIIPLLI